MSVFSTIRQITKLYKKIRAGDITPELLQKFSDNPTLVLNNAQILCLEPLNTAKFLSDNCSIDEEDERSLAIDSVDISRIQLQNMLRDDEKIIKGEQRLSRLKDANHIRLDARFFQAFWNNQDLIPRYWVGYNVCFDGTIFRTSNGNRVVLCLYKEMYEWEDCYDSVERDCSRYHPHYSSAVLVR